MEKLLRGVLRVATPLGPRYISLSLTERMYLLWTFRHFANLPQQVLSRRQQALIESLCGQQAFVAFSHGLEAPVIGTVERRPMPEVAGLPPRRLPTSVTDRSGISPFAAERNRT